MTLLVLWELVLMLVTIYFTQIYLIEKGFLSEASSYNLTQSLDGFITKAPYTLQILDVFLTGILFLLWFKEISVQRKVAIEAAPYELIEEIGKED